MMTKIDTPYGEYNENVLTADFTFDNVKAWEFVVGAGIPGNTVGSSTEEHFVGEKSLKIHHEEYNLNAITVRPTNSGDYEFTVPRDGWFRFSIRTLLQATAPWLPEVNGGISFYKNGAGAAFKTFQLKIGNNSEPEFSYAYNKWQTFFEDVYLTEDDVISLSIHITYESLYTPGILNIYFDGFKVEYVTDRVFEEPSIYTLPIN